MLDAKMVERLNKQLNEELYSSYLYLAMSAYFHGEGLDGFAHWLRLQSQEETAHAMRIFAYINDRGGKVVLQAVAEPPTSYKSYTEVFEKVLNHEQHITTLLNELMDQANQLHDHATHAFLQWFVTEQVEEEASASEVLQKAKMVGDNAPGLLALDRVLGGRSAAG